MKKSTGYFLLLVTSIFLIVACNGKVRSRSNGLEITGIGPFKLGDSITILTDLDYPLSHRIISGHDKYGSTYWYEIIELKSGDDFETYYDASLFDSVRTFYVPKQRINDDLFLKNILLKFYEDKLYEIEFDLTDDIVNALTLKYGTPESYSEDDRKHYKWETNVDNISCFGLDSRFASRIWIDYNDISRLVFDKELEISKLKEKAAKDRLIENI